MHLLMTDTTFYGTQSNLE